MSGISSNARRTNNDWLSELRGMHGPAPQEAAHRDLANYLYVVAFNYLQQRQHALAILAALDPQELAALAQDFVQDALLKLAQDNGVLLNQFRGEGAFTGWCARLLCNLIARELRRPFWQRRAPGEEALGRFATRSAEQLSQIEQLGAAIKHCLEQLQERRRVAFERCIIHDIPTDEVAHELSTSANGVYQLVFHARRELRLCLESCGVGPDTLAIFRE